jgi:hypothetical protein
MAKSLKQVDREVAANDPPVEVGQIWIARGKGRKIIRRMQILASLRSDLAPNRNGRWWIVRDLPSKMMRASHISTIPEFNLRYVFRLQRNGR